MSNSERGKMSEIIKRLKQIKEEKHYTYDMLSTKLGFNSQTIARWFRLKKINKQYEKLLEDRIRFLL